MSEQKLQPRLAQAISYYPIVENPGSMGFGRDRQIVRTGDYVGE